jgi:GxxExxY protein
MAIRRAPGLAEQTLTGSIIGAFFEVYNTLGYGFRESVYVAALERELIARGHMVAREVQLRVFYKGDRIARQRIDMLIDDKVIVESKATEFVAPNATRQLENYLRGSQIEVGLLLHFGPRPVFFRRFVPNRSISNADPPLSDVSA